MKKLLFIAAIAFSLTSNGQNKDTGKYAEIIFMPTSAIVSNEKGLIMFDAFTDNVKPAAMPCKYPIDALNYMAKRGWHLVNIFSVVINGVECRHYVIER